MVDDPRRYRRPPSNVRPVSNTDDSADEDTPVDGGPLQQIVHRIRKAEGSIQAVRTDVSAVAARQAQDVGHVHAAIGRVEERLDMRCSSLDGEVRDIAKKVDEVAGTVSELGRTTVRIDTNMTAIVKSADAAGAVARDDARIAAELKSRRNVAIIAVIGPILAALIAALATIAIRG